ncbi:hypothetical protein T01_11928, partial [Trichinella spiralis]
MHKNRFPALRYANNDRHKRCLIVSKGALVRLTYVASRSVVKRSLRLFTAFLASSISELIVQFFNFAIYEQRRKKKRKHGLLVEQIADDMKWFADDTKRIADGTKQNKKRQK